MPAASGSSLGVHIDGHRRRARTNAPQPSASPAPNLSNPAPNSSFAAAFSSQSPRSHSTRYRASSFESRMSRRTVQSSERILHSHSLHSIITNVSVCSVFLAVALRRLLVFVETHLCGSGGVGEVGRRGWNRCVESFLG